MGIDVYCDCDICGKTYTANTQSSCVKIALKKLMSKFFLVITL